MRYEIDLGERPSMIRFKVDVTANQMISIVGYDATKENTTYFAKTVNIKSRNQVIELPMPISPEKLTLVIEQSNGAYGSYINVDNFTVTDLPQRNTLFPEKTMEFYNFLKTFAKKAGYIQPGFYVSKDENYMIWAKPHLDDDGTPARVNRRTGVVKFNISKMKEYTVFMRVFIGLHEFFHYALQTTDEVKADLGALNVYLSMGYPKSEANYAMTKVFDNSPSAIKRVEILDNYIKQFQKAELSYKKR